VGRGGGGGGGGGGAGMSTLGFGGERKHVSYSITSLNI